MKPSYAHSLTIRDLEKGETYINNWLTQKVNDRVYPDEIARFDAFTHILRNPDTYSGRHIAELQHFYLGVITLKHSKEFTTEETRILLLTESMDHLRKCLEPKVLPANPGYYAQWQIGLIMEQLGSSWQEIQEALMDAQNIYNKRAEAVAYVIKSLRNNGQIGWAYVYSQVAKDQYTGKIPPETVWGVDPTLYEWKLMNYHMSVCNRLGNMAEAEKSYQTLWAFHETHPNYFNPQQLEQLLKNKKQFVEG